jgi:endonuclease/exonuclease/phosphatase family metal-dependent hydrolase
MAVALVTLALGSCQSKPSTPAHFAVGTYNLRYANHGDSVEGNGWGQRCPVIAQLIRYHGFDIFGTQEGLIGQLTDLEAALPGYKYIGVGRDDGKEAGEHSAIFYRTDEFELMDQGNFWLSETPDVPSKGWDAVLPRICTWGHFKYKPTGLEFLFFNLHMDHIGKQARVESAFLVQKKMVELGKDLPAILTGDFNVDQTSSSYQALVSKGVLVDAYEKADIRYVTNGTFNGYHTDGFTTSRIDHIFLSPSFHVLKYGVLTDAYWTPAPSEEKAELKDAPNEINAEKYVKRVPSDHYPVRVVISD